MSFIKTKDGTEILYEDWGLREGRQSSFITAGRSVQTIGTARCYSSSTRVSGSSPMTAVGHGRSA
jgi:hypothetical protein